MAGKHALLIACSGYTDATLSRLEAPAGDAARLGQLLAAPDIGEFDIDVLAEPTATQMLTGLERFLAGRARGDLAVVYFSGHGWRDRRGAFYLTAVDTDLEHPRSTAMPGSLLQEMLDDSKARSQVLLLDCCFSAAFVGKGRKGASPVGQRAEPGPLVATGDGRYVITATGANEYAFEVGGDIEGRGVRSRFTSFLVEGLETGAADTDTDGWITVDELFEYARQRIAETADPARPQTPWKYVSEQAGAVVLARSRATADSRQMIAKAMAAVTDPHPAMRVAGVTLLADLMGRTDEDQAGAEQARLRLEALADADADDRVRSAAVVALSGGHVGAALQSQAAITVSPPGVPSATRPAPDDGEAVPGDDGGHDDLRAGLQSSDGEVVPPGAVRFSVRLHNAGPRPLSGLEVLLDGQTVASGISVDPGRRRRIRAHLPLAGSGRREVRLLVVGPGSRRGLVKAEATCTVVLDEGSAPELEAQTPAPAEEPAPELVSTEGLGALLGEPWPEWLGRSRGVLGSWLAAPEVSGEWTSVSNDLRWGAVEGAEGYVVERATDEDFSDAVVVQEGDSLYCFDWFSRDDFPHHAGTVWYRVHAAAEGRFGLRSGPVEISGDFSGEAAAESDRAAAPSIGELLQPHPSSLLVGSWLAAPEVSGEWTSVSNDLRWGAVEGAEGYVVERATDEDFSDAVVVQEGDSLFCFDWFSRDDFPRHAGTVWYRVQARAAGRIGFWSRPVEISGDFSLAPADTASPRWTGLLERFRLSGIAEAGHAGDQQGRDAPLTFTPGLGLLVAPTLTVRDEAGPARPLLGLAGTVLRLWWTPVLGATAYEVQGTLLPDFSNPLDVYSGTETSTTFNPFLATATWHFRARAVLGASAGPWSETATWFASAGG